MATKWSEAEEAVLNDRYETADTVDELAEQLGRPRSTVVKKALAMGLHRGMQHQKSMALLKSVMTDCPSTSGEIASRMGIHRTSATEVLNRGYAEGLCHIAKFKSCGGKGRDLPLWVKGPGKHAKNCAQKLLIAPVQAAQALIVRDPLAVALFGVPKTIQLVTKLPTRIYQQDMSVRADELEAA